MDGNLSQDADFDQHDFAQQDFAQGDLDAEDIVELGPPVAPVGLHRLSAVRCDLGMSCFDVARRLGITVEEARLQEESPDLPISTLNLWATALDLPVTDLIVESEEWVHATHLAKSTAEHLLRVAAKLRDGSRRRSIQRLAQTFLDQLAEIQPALGPIANGNGHNRRSPRGNGASSSIPRRESPNQ